MNSYYLLRFFAIRSARFENAELSISSPPCIFRLLLFLLELSSSLINVTRREGLMLLSSAASSFFIGEPLSEGKNALGVFREVGNFEFLSEDFRGEGKALGGDEAFGWMVFI